MTNIISLKNNTMNRVDKNRIKEMIENPLLMSADDKKLAKSVKGELSAYAVSRLFPKKVVAKKEATKKVAKKATNKSKK